MKLTRKQQFCLDRLAEGDFCTFDLSKMAIASGDNRVVCQYEWADAPTRQLRGMGLVEFTGEKSRWERRILRITAAGRAARADEGEAER